jgi:GNAT acetyltransferase 2
VAPRALADLPPLFTRLQERKAELLHYLGVSYGLTSQLLRFWQRLGYAPVYLRQAASDTTGEHTCIMLKALAAPDVADAVRCRCLLLAAVRAQTYSALALSRWRLIRLRSAPLLFVPSLVQGLHIVWPPLWAKRCTRTWAVQLCCNGTV